MTETKPKPQEAAPANWNAEVSKRVQRLQTIESFCGIIAEGAQEDHHCLYWWVENETRAARELIETLYRELGTRRRGETRTETILADLDKRSLRLETISQAASMLVDSNEAPSAVWLWIAREMTAAARCIDRLWDACQEASGSKTVGQ